MQGYLLRRSHDPLAIKLAGYCQPLPSTSMVVQDGNNILPTAPRAKLHVWVFQARQLAVRPLFEPMYARHGLRTRCYLVCRGSEGPEPVGRVHESERNAGGSMRHPVWRRHHHHGQEGGGVYLLLEGGESDVSLVVEIVCGILVVASATVELDGLAERGEALQPHWTPLGGGDAGLLELALTVEPIEEEEEEKEEIPVRASAWMHKQARELRGNNELQRDVVSEKEPDEPTLEYSSSSDEHEVASDDADPRQEEQPTLEARSSRQDVAPTSRVVEEDTEELQWRQGEAARRARMELPPGRVRDVTVARAGGTTMYIPHQTSGSLSSSAKRKTSRTPAGNEQDRLMDKQLWDLYVFGIADSAPGAPRRDKSGREDGDSDRRSDDKNEDDQSERLSPSEFASSASFVSRSASTCVSDVLAYNEFIQDMEAAITQERLGKQLEQQQRDDNQEGGTVGVGWSQTEQPDTITEPHVTARQTPVAANVTAPPVPVRRRAVDPSPRPREGVVLFDPTSLPLPLVSETVTSRQQQRRRSVMVGASADAARPQAQGARRRSLPINAVYAQLQRKLLAGVHAIRRQPDKQQQQQQQQQTQPEAPHKTSTPPQTTTTAVPHPELMRKRSMSLHAYTDLFARPGALELVDASRHHSNSNGGVTPSRDSSSPSSSSSSASSGGLSRTPSPFNAAPLSSRRSSAGTGAVAYLQGELLCVGRRILVGRSVPGVVRYIGPVRFAPGAWIGVELMEPKGKSDGAVDGMRYFSCAPGHGILLRANRLDLRLLP